MNLPKSILEKLAIASGACVLGGVAITGSAIYQAHVYRLNPCDAQGVFQEPSALVEFGLSLGYRFKIWRPPCGMCGTG